MIEALHRLDYRPDAVMPLDGVRVVDLSRLVAGNMASHVLADYGAEVIKVEHPRRGDDLRDWRVEGVSTYWKVYGRNKKSLALDYRGEAGLAVLRDLVATAAVLIENFVPGKLERLGLAPDDLLARNPKLVILRISGWGQTGPYRGRPGFGTVVEAASGLAAMTGFPDRPPVLPPLALADMVTGLYGASAVAVAVRHAERGGSGQVIDLSLFDPILSILGPEAANYVLTGRSPERRGSRASNAAPRNVYECSDGKFVALSASMQSMTERLLKVMGRADLIDDPRFRTNEQRLAHVEELDALVAAFIGERSQAENLDLFDRTGITAGPVNEIGDLVDHPHVVARESLVVLPDAEMGELPMHNVVARMSGVPGAIRSAAPALGAHNAEILAELGLGDAMLARLRDAGAIP